MPIRKELRHLYRGPKWEATRKRILERAKNRCEQCGKPNGERVETTGGRLVGSGPYMFWRGSGSGWTSHAGEEIGDMLRPVRVRAIRAQLGVAHLNHKPGDDRDENLKALCNWCHLHYDQLQHKASRSKRKDAGRPLLQEAS